MLMLSKLQLKETSGRSVVEKTAREPTVLGPGFVRGLRQWADALGGEATLVKRLGLGPALTSAAVIVAVVKHPDGRWTLRLAPEAAYAGACKASSDECTRHNGWRRVKELGAEMAAEVRPVSPLKNRRKSAMEGEARALESWRAEHGSLDEVAKLLGAAAVVQLGADKYVEAGVFGAADGPRTSPEDTAAPLTKDAASPDLAQSSKVVTSFPISFGEIAKSFTCNAL